MFLCISYQADCDETYLSILTICCCVLSLAGAGIGIRINDDGVDSDHIEFSSKFDIQSSCSLYKPIALDEKHSHGTTCASIAAGSGNNGACAVGIAPNATISGCRIFKTLIGDELASEQDDESYFYSNMENMHVSSNSYAIPSCRSSDSSSSQGKRRLQQCPFVSSAPIVGSPCSATDCSGVDWSNPSPTDACEELIRMYCKLNFENDVPACTNFLDLFVTCDFNSLSTTQQFALMKGVTEGRNGKGIVYVFAAGDDFDAGADVNFYGYQNSRHGITVGAVDKSGKHSSYSNGGAALFISAPGGDSDLYTNNVVALAGGGCTDGGSGTSFATPVVSGVVALMLEANPELSWRDVHGVLATSATKIQPNDPSWTTNGAGLSHSYLYGFGLVNASSAVALSITWELLTTEMEIDVDSGEVDIRIPDFPSDPITSLITVGAFDSFKVETVLVYLDLYHSSRGDLIIVLTSPSGTQSILSPGKRPENSQDVERWKLMTVRNRNEPANGDWTLSIVDQKVGDISNCLDSIGWSTDFQGTLKKPAFACEEFQLTKACLDGAIGPNFSTLFPNRTALSDPFFAGVDGTTPNVACCACGGGVPATNRTDILRSWRLVIYGSDQAAEQKPPSTPTVASINDTIATSAPNNKESPISSASSTNTVLITAVVGGIIGGIIISLLGLLFYFKCSRDTRGTNDKDEQPKHRSPLFDAVDQFTDGMVISSNTPVSSPTVQAPQPATRFAVDPPTSDQYQVHYKDQSRSVISGRQFVPIDTQNSRSGQLQPHDVPFATAVPVSVTKIENSPTSP